MPIQELGAIEVDVESKCITNVFYAFANCEEEDDYFSRLHVHGLNTSYLKRHGFVNELTLLQALKDRLKKKPFIRTVPNCS